MRKNGKGLTSVYRFKVLGLMFLIQEDCLMSLEGNRMSFVAWNDLQTCFQFCVFKQNFQVCVLVSSAASCQWAWGFWSGLCIEWIRSRRTLQILCIHGFWDLIFQDLFPIFFHAIFVQIISNSLQIFPYLIMHEFLSLLHVQKDLIN